MDSPEKFHMWIKHVELFQMWNFTYWPWVTCEISRVNFGHVKSFHINSHAILHMWSTSQMWNYFMWNSMRNMWNHFTWNHMKLYIDSHVEFHMWHFTPVKSRLIWNNVFDFTLSPGYIILSWQEILKYVSTRVIT